VSVTASKLATAPDDVNKTESQANQDAVTVTQSGNVITISGSLDALNSFASTNEAQGSGKWIGLDLNTGLDTIVGAKWGNYTLTQDDADEAASVGLGAGHIIFWTKAETLPKTISINGEDFIVKFVDTTI
jgi:hypothetical protein